MAAACSGGASDAISLRVDGEATDSMVNIALAAQTCWFKSKDPAFLAYRLANEVNSPAGRPRILLVPRSDPSALPLLVVQAERSGGKTEIQTFGPILSTDAGTRIAADVTRWSGGSQACA